MNIPKSLKQLLDQADPERLGEHIRALLNQDDLGKYMTALLHEVVEIDRNLDELTDEDLRFVGACQGQNIQRVVELKDRTNLQFQDLPNRFIAPLTQALQPERALKLLRCVDGDEERAFISGAIGTSPMFSAIYGYPDIETARTLLEAGAEVPTGEDFFRPLLDRDNTEIFFKKGSLSAETFYEAFAGSDEAFRKVARHNKPNRPTVTRVLNRLIALSGEDLNKIRRIETLEELNDDFTMDWSYTPARGSSEKSCSPLGLLGGFAHRDRDERIMPRRSLDVLRSCGVMGELVDMGADPNEDPSAMNEAIKNGDRRAVQQLIDHGFEPAEHPSVGATIFAPGVKKRRLKFKTLLENGMDPTEKPDEYLRALQPDQYDESSTAERYEQYRGCLNRLAGQGINFNREEGQQALRQWLQHCRGQGPYVEIVDAILDAQRQRGSFSPPDQALLRDLRNEPVFSAIKPHLNGRQLKSLKTD